MLSMLSSISGFVKKQTQSLHENADFVYFSRLLYVFRTHVFSPHPAFFLFLTNFAA